VKRLNTEHINKAPQEARFRDEIVFIEGRAFKRQAPF
jgi:hypothetical protein